MESAELGVTSVQTTDGILLETETAQNNELILDGSRLDTDRTQLDAGDKILLESSTYGKFTRGETITGQTSNAAATVLAEDLDNNRLFISAQDKFIDGEEVVGASSNATAIINNYKPNPVTNIQDLLNFRDPDKVISNFLTKFRNEFLNTLPETLSNGVDKRKLIKNVKSLYKAKGTNRGHELFFRLLFGVESETIYPRENILRASDGNWDTSNVLRVISNIGDTSDLVGRKITGQTSKATAIVENVYKFQIGTNEVTEFILNKDTILGTFIVSEEVIGTSTNSDDFFIKSNVTGIPTEVSIVNDGTMYNEGDNIELNSGGVGALLQIDAVGRSGISDFIIDNPGSGYEIGDNIQFDNSNTDGGNATAKVSVVNGGLTLETSISTTEDHIVLEDETTRGDSYTGNKIVQESGTGLGDITDIRIINSGSNYKSFPSVSVLSTSGTNAVIRAYGNEIGRVLQIKVIEPGSEYQQSPTPPVLTLPNYILIKNLSSNFSIGETISGLDASSTLITATVSSYNSTLGILKVTNSTGQFLENTTITGNSSGQTAKVAKNDFGTATCSVGSILQTTGRFINEDGWISENAMKIQDSLYYQDFSYVIKVGRTINQWRDSFKKTLHTSGFYFAAQVGLENRLNVKIKSPVEGILSGSSESPLLGLLKLLFGNIVGRRLGTIDDGTSQRSNPHTALPFDLDTSTTEHFTNNTRDITLSREPVQISYLTRMRRIIDSTFVKNGFAYAGPKYGSINKFANTMYGTSTNSGITFDTLNRIKVFGTKTSLDGTNAIFLLTSNEEGQKIKTNFAFPTIISTDNISFDNDSQLYTFDSDQLTFDNDTP
jgi:hypothetical protein